MIYKKLKSKSIGKNKLLILLLPLSFILSASDGCPAGDDDFDGYSEIDGDCDDHDPLTYQNAQELCDGKDNNCNRLIDEGVKSLFCIDQDHDGFGTEDISMLSCIPAEGFSAFCGDCNDILPSTNPIANEVCDGVDNNCDTKVDINLEEGPFVDNDGDNFGIAANVCDKSNTEMPWVSVRGDCKDDDEHIYPGAVDIDDDGVDSDCGGKDSQQPSVGLESSLDTTIRTALGLAENGDHIWVGAGSYYENNIVFPAESSIKLISTHGKEKTIIDGKKASGTIFSILNQSNYVSEVSGFTIQNGSSPLGGAITIYNSSPNIHNLVIKNSFAEDAGGGVYIRDSLAIIHHLEISGNKVKWGQGGGLAAYDSHLQLTEVNINNNQATFSTDTGGGIILDNVAAGILNTKIENNSASVGGGVVIRNAAPILKNVIITNNSASDTAGLKLYAANPVVLNSVITGNKSLPVVGNGSYQTGGIYSLFSSPVFYNTLIADNIGAAVYSVRSEPEFRFCTIALNGAYDNGSMMFIASPGIIDSSAISYNAGYNIYVIGDVPTMTYNNIYTILGQPYNIIPADVSNISNKPSFISYSNDGNNLNDDYHLSSSSLLRNAGNPKYFDPDGSRADIGMYAGPYADFSFYRDIDGDSLYDGWEKLYYSDISLYGKNDDIDKDGLPNYQEQSYLTNPSNYDSDKDSFDDKEELLMEKDPLDWYSQPNNETVVHAKIPHDFTTIKEAIDSIKWFGGVDISAGTYLEGLFISNKSLILKGESKESTIIDGQNTHRPIISAWSNLNIETLKIQNGFAENGAAVYMQGNYGVWNDIIISNSKSTQTGGGVSVFGSSLTIKNSKISENESSDGGGIYSYEAMISLYQTTVSNNKASNAGGGLSVVFSEASINNSIIDQNISTTYGGGLFIDDYNGDTASAQIKNSWINNNTSEFGGGIFVNEESYTEIDNTLFYDNKANQFGGAIMFWDTLNSVNQCILAYNTASLGGGIYMDQGSPFIKNSVLAYNGSYNLYIKNSSNPWLETANNSSVQYNDFYNPPSENNHNMIRLPTTNIVFEPQFIDSKGLDFHLLESSRLVNAGDPLHFDPDGSIADIGIYGGMLASSWDLDNDGYPYYYWPGWIDSPPNNEIPENFDCNDLDPLIHICVE